MRTIVLYLGNKEKAEKVAAFLGCEAVPYSKGSLESAFNDGVRIVAMMATGIVVRSIAPHLRDKWIDPPVVVLSPDLRYSIPLLGGHHGANDLARELEGLGARPVITTATEAQGLEAAEVVASQRDMAVINRDSTRAVNAAVLREHVPVHVIGGPAMVVAGPAVSVMCHKGDHFVGLGCNRGTAAEEVEGAVRSALGELGIGEDRVMVFATTRKKIDEPGLSVAVQRLQGNLVFIDDETLNAQEVEQSKASIIGLKGVAEPAALAVSVRKELVFRRKAYGNVTVAIAR